MWINHLLYGQPPPGLDVKLSIDLELQNLAEESLGDIPGAVVLMNAENGEILVMASNPAYDPNKLVEIWEELNAREDAPLVNRATQGRYPPGEALSPFLLAAKELELYSDQEILTLFKDLGFFSSPRLRLPTALQETPDSLVFDDMRLSPLQIALAAASLSNAGTIPAPRFLNEVENPEGGWNLYPPLGEPITIFEGSVANKIANTLAHDSLPIWQLVAAATSQTGQPLTWYLGGTLPGAETPYVVVILLEIEDNEKVEEISKVVFEALFFPK